MKTHAITITVTAPNRLTASEVQRHIERMIWIGKEDAAESLNRGTLNPKAAKDAMSLHLKFGDLTEPPRIVVAGKKATSTRSTK